MEYSINTKYLQKVLLFTLVVILIIPLLTFAVVGSHSRYAADDFQNYAGVKEFGLLGYLTERYQNWMGRFSYIFLNSLFYLIGPSIVPVLPLISLILLSSIWYLVINSIFQLLNLKSNHIFSYLLSLALILSTFASLENIRQVLFWQSGLFNYVSPMILLPCLLLGIIKMLQYEINDKEPHKIIYFLVPTITFISGAFTEMYSVAQIFLLSGLIVYFLINFYPSFLRKTYSLLFISLGSAILSTMIVVVAPGNAFHQLDYPQPPSLKILPKMITQYSYVFISRQIKNKYLFMGIAFFSPLIGWLLKDNRQTITNAQNLFKTKRALNYITLFIVCLLVLMSTFIAPAWGTSNYPEPRASSIATYIFSIIVLLIGTTVGYEYKKRIPMNAISNYFIGLICVGFLFFGSARITINQILLELPEAQEFSSHWDRRDKILRTAVENEVNYIEVKEIPNYYSLEQLEEFSPGYQWINSEMSRYYNISSIYLKSND